MVVNNVTSRLAREAQPAGEDGAVLIDGVTCRTYGDFVDKITELVTDDATMAQLGRQRDRRRHDQRVPAATAVQPAGADRAYPRRPA